MLKKLLVQLQRRRVTRAAIVYSGSAWLLLQAAEIIFPKLGLSENAVTMVLVLAVGGFPISLVLSWIFDITSDGIKMTSDADSSGDVVPAHLTPLRITAIVASMLVFVVVGYFYPHSLSENKLSLFTEESAPKVAPVRPAEPVITDDTGQATIAVLPFKNFSDAADMEYFGDGLAEEILNLLSKLNELRVAARTSSFYFKDKNFDIPTIAQHLGVRYVLEGSVRHSRDQIRVTAQLIDASNGFHVWSETYDRTTSNIFSVQDEIGREVVKNLKIALSSKSKDLLERDLNVDPYAYELYLRGRDYLRGPGDNPALHNAESMFTKAIKLSPAYSDALAGLCDTLLQQYFADVEKDRFTKAEQACQRAQALDSGTSAVYIALGNLYRASGQYTLAEREFNRALSLKPTAVDAYVGLAETFKLEEKYALAEQTLIRAMELEPKNWAASMAMGRYLFNVGRVEESIPYFERIDELMPESNAAANSLGSAYFVMGRFEEAASVWEKALGGAPMAGLYANLGSSYFFLGRYDEAATIYQRALEMAPAAFENWGNLADAYRHSPAQSDLAPAAYERAIALAKQHLQINPSDAVAIAALGHYLACMGEREASLENLKLAEQLAQKEMLVYYFSATALCALHDQDQALQATGTALSLGYPAHMVEADAGLSCLRGMPEYSTTLTQSVREDAQLTHGESNDAKNN